MSHVFVMDVMIYQMMTDKLENTAILNVKGVDYKCILQNMMKNDAINRLNNSKLNNEITL